MVGLLDLLTKDPEQQRALTQGLLSGAFGAMAGRGSRLQAWGQGGLAGLAGYGQSLDRSAQERERAQQMERQKIQDQLLQGQLGQMKREQQIAELPNQFMVPGMKPDTMDNRDVGMPGEQQIPAQSFDQPGYLNALKGLDFNRWLSTSAALHQPEPAPIKASPGDVFFNRGGQKLFEVPAAAEKEPEQIRQLKAIYGDGTPAYQAALQRLGGKMTTHSPAASITNYGAPVPVQLPGGGIGYVQPTNRGGPVAPMVDSSGSPLKKPSEGAGKDPTEFQAKAGLYFKSMQTATQTLDSIERTNGWRPSALETGAPGETTKTLVQSEARQKYTQAQRQWIDSINRVRSGANLPELEYDRAVRTFFPTFGEGESIRQQKAAARAQEETAMAEAAGRALPSGEAAQRASVMPEVSAIDAELERRRRARGGK